PYFRHANGLESVTLSPDGGRVLTIGEKPRLSGFGSMWVSMYATSAVGALAPRHWGSDLLDLGGVLPVLVSWSEPPDARLWDAATGRPIGPVLRHPGGVRGASFSPDGQYALTWGGKIVQVWDAATGQPSGLPVTADSDVSDVTFSAGGRRMLVVSEDDAARVW